MVAWSHLVYISCISLVFERFALLQVVSESVAHTFSIGSSMVVLLRPFAGLVASAYYGRYRTVYASFWFMWSGSIAIVFLLVINGLLLEAHQSWIYSGVVIAEVVYFIGFTAFAVTIWTGSDARCIWGAHQGFHPLVRLVSFRWSCDSFTTDISSGLYASPRHWYPSVVCFLCSANIGVV